MSVGGVSSAPAADEGRAGSAWFVDQAIASLRPFADAPTLAAAMEYAVFSGGKRLRARLALAAGTAITNASRDVTPVAVAIELLHAASLVLDDLPEMDDAAERRGRPALHRLFGGGTALLCSHSLVSRALEAVAEAELASDLRCEIVAELAWTVGGRGMAAGQADDLSTGASGGTLTALAIARRKTGVLFRAAAYCGARAAGAPRSVAAEVGRVGLLVGTAYQLADDLRDRDEDLERGRWKGGSRVAARARVQAYFAGARRRLGRLDLDRQALDRVLDAIASACLLSS